MACTDWFIRSIFFLTQGLAPLSPTLHLGRYMHQLVRWQATRQ